MNQAVKYALLSGVAACGGRSTEPGAGPLSPSFSFPVAGSPEGAPDPSSEPAEDVAGLACAMGEGSRWARMSLDADYDFVALRSSHPERQLAEELPTGREMDAHGTPCGSAADAVACQAALELAWPTSESDWIECGQAGCTAYGVTTTRADEVRSRESLAEIAALLGALDTPEESLLWADANGYTLRCEPDTLFELPRMTLRELAGGYRLGTYEMVESCPIKYQKVVVDISRDGQLEEVVRVDHEPTWSGSACVGRRPPGLVASSEPAGAGDVACSERELGAFFARVATLEAAAVLAFERIEAELAALGAPAELCQAARAARADEVRHAGVYTALARRHGAEPAAPEVTQQPLRGLLELALDNGVEGCVRETFGAAVAEYQAATAREAAVRAQLSLIASEETRHAELSWRIRAWLCSRLARSELAELRAAERAALGGLRSELELEVPASVQRIAGMPSRARSLELLAALEASLWVEPDSVAA